MCLMISMIKYIYKYVYKNKKHTTTIIWKNFNEIEDYYADWYLNFLKAIWRIFEFRIHEEFPAVNVFSIYLKNEQIVYFSSNIFFQKLKKRKKKTFKLNWWFILNITLRILIMFRGFIPIFLFISFEILKAGSENSVNKNPRLFVCIMWIQLQIKDSDYDFFWWLCWGHSFLNNCIELMMFNFHFIDSHVLSVVLRKMMNIDIIVLMTTLFMPSFINCDCCLSLTCSRMRSAIRGSFEINIMSIFSTIFFIVLNEKGCSFRNFWRIFITIIACIFFVMLWKNKIKSCKIVVYLIWCSIEPRNTIKSKKNHNSWMMLRSQRTCKQNWISINCKHLFELSRPSIWIRRPLIFTCRNRKKWKKSFCIKLFVIIIIRKKNEFCVSHLSK